MCLNKERKISKSLRILLRTSNETIEMAHNLFQSCHQKSNKVYSHSRLLSSFYFRRAWEMFESFIILIRENRLVDSVIILRSLCNMTIDLSYILSEPNQEEIRAIKFLLAGDKEQKNIVKHNKEEFKKYYPDIETRLMKLEENIRLEEEHLSKQYKEKNWNLPKFYKRAAQAGPHVHNYYNQVYSYYSNIEHHNYLFGQAYVDVENCEPLKDPEKIESSSFFRPEMTLFLCRGLFIEILKGFNTVFKLKWKKNLDELMNKHLQELELI